MTHKKILEMIEKVDPRDSDTLDEIDARVQCYVLGHEYVRLKKDGSLCYYDKSKDMNYTLVNPSIGDTYGCTRSRDAIKSIRPDGWHFHGMGTGWNEPHWFMGELEDEKDILSAHLPTEELAELHAVIQAIAHERGED